METVGTTSFGLLRSIRSKDSIAWQKLVHVYGPLIYGWAKRSGLQESDAADITQEVLTAVWSNMDKFSHDAHGSSFRAWLRTICKNKILDLHRRNGKNPIAQGGTTGNVRMHELAQGLTEPESAEAQVEIDDLRARVLEQVQSMFKQQVWTSFWRTVIEGDRPEDVAEDIGVSVWAVYKAKARVLQRLRSEMEGFF